MNRNTCKLLSSIVRQEKFKHKRKKKRRRRKMKGAQSTCHHSYTLSLLLVSILLFHHPTVSVDVNTLSSTESLTISSNRTLVSPGGVFELGFFKPSALQRWYLGIWYREVFDQKTYAWVANRDNPLSNSIGTLKISGNNLVLLGHSVLWSTNLTRGNLIVLRW